MPEDSPYEAPFGAKEIVCPLCGSPSYTRVLPSRKKSAKTRCAAEQTRFWQSVCERCGLIYENPTVDVTRDRSYNEQHYYDLVGFPPQLAHLHQAITAEFRYACLKDRVDFPRLSKLLDIGSVGSWPAYIGGKFPHLETHLLEPSRTAIEFARHSFRGLHCHHSMIEEAFFEDASFDFISFFHSLYAISTPLPALRQCRRILRDDGHLVVAISLLSMELEIRKDFGRRQWLGLDALARTIALVTYSRRTLEAALEAAGFELIESFIARDDNPGSPNCGREDYYALCRPAPDGRSASIPERPEEVRWAKDFLRQTTAKATKTVLETILKRSSGGELLLVYDDRDYRDALLTMLQAIDERCAVTCHPSSTLLSLRDAGVPDSTQVTILNASAKRIDAKAEGYLHTVVYNGVSDFFVEGDYAFCVRDPEGEPLVATFFDPPELPAVRAYPFAPNQVESRSSTTAFDLAALSIDRKSLPEGFAEAFQPIEMLKDIRHEDGYAFSAAVRSQPCIGELPRLPRNSPFVLLEDGAPLILAHASRRDVVQYGRGRYRHEGTRMLFSSSDGVPPGENGRRYELAVRRVN